MLYHLQMCPNKHVRGDGRGFSLGLDCAEDCVRDRTADSGTADCAGRLQRCMTGRPVTSSELAGQISCAKGSAASRAAFVESLGGRGRRIGLAQERHRFTRGPERWSSEQTAADDSGR